MHRLLAFLSLLTLAVASVSSAHAPLPLLREAPPLRESVTTMAGRAPDAWQRRDGAAWIVDTDALSLRSDDGEVQQRFELGDAGFGAAVASSADPYDDSVWIVTDAARLLHFSRDASLRSATVLPPSVNAVGVDLDESVWVLAQRELLHFDREGRLLAAMSLDVASDELAIDLSVDSLRGRIWIATTRRMLRVPYDAKAIGSATEVPAGNAAAVAVDPASGAALAIVDDTLIALDADGTGARAIALPVAPEPRSRLRYDAADDAIEMTTGGSTLSVTRDARIAATRAGAPAVTPFRIEPALTLLRPPSGASVTDAYVETILVVRSVCNDEPCASADRYLEGMRVEADVDGASWGTASIDTRTGRVAFADRPPLRPGRNRLHASAIDRFGHRAEVDEAQLTLVAPPDEDRAMKAQDRVAETTAKAANKAPAVALTAPLAGTTFTAGTTISLKASASDPDGTIAKVEFYRGTTLLGASTIAPYEYQWVGAPAGTYSLTAKAYDNRNGTATSAPASIVVVNNQAPVVAITSPAAGSFFAAGTSIEVSASASDPDGTIASVEFLDGSVSIGTATMAPYAVQWNGSTAGVHALTARARDDRGSVRVSAPVDVVIGEPPLVVITAPVGCTTVDAQTDVPLAADARSAVGRIVDVQFFDNGAPAGSSATPPWRTTLHDPGPGDHVIVAKATDDRGLTATSRGATFTVAAANQPPSVTITAPAEGARYPLGASIGVTATAADADGSIGAVEFRIGSASGTLIGRATQPPYMAAWSGAAPGSYALVAVASDNRGATTTSAAVHVSVDANAAPAVTLTAPLANATFAAPASINLAAFASDSDGTIAKVDFYLGSNVIATTTTPPYAATWNGVGPGSYSITAKATDDRGAVAVSSPASITVTTNAPPTVALTAPASGAQFFGPSTIALAANAADADGVIARVEFLANGTTIGSSSAPPYGIVWDGVDAGAYTLVARAIDNLGGVATSQAVGIVVNGGPSIDSLASLDGPTVDDDGVSVQGVVRAPANSAVAVNGIVAHIDDLGGFQVNDVPLAPGANIVTAVVTTQDGQSASRSITVESNGQGAFVVRASPTEGIESLDVTFTVENRGITPFKEIRLDLDGDGLPNLVATAAQFVNDELVVMATYPIGTWRATIRVYDDQDRVIYAATKSIVVRVPSLVASSLRGVYEAMLLRLRANNVAGALTAFTGSSYDKYSAIFAQLQPVLPSILDQLGTVSDITFDADLAEIGIVRETPEGAQRFLLYLIRAEDGIWRIDAM